MTWTNAGRVLILLALLLVWPAVPLVALVAVCLPLDRPKGTSSWRWP